MGQVVTTTFYIHLYSKYINPSKKAQRFYDVNPDSIKFSNLNMKLILEKGRLYFPRQLRANSIQRRICEKVIRVLYSSSSSNVFILIKPKPTNNAYVSYSASKYQNLPTISYT